MKKLTLEEIDQQRVRPDEYDSVERFPIYVLLDNIRSLHNVGSIFRSADAARVSRLYLCGITGVPPRPEIGKTALGATETVPWEYRKDAAAVLDELRDQNCRIVALEHTDRSVAHRKARYDFPCCLVIGNEVWGVQEELLEKTDLAVEIPMYGSKHSLNVSVAFGVAMDQILSQFIDRHHQ